MGLVLLGVNARAGAEDLYGGPYSDWPTQSEWIPIPSLDEGRDHRPKSYPDIPANADFVGNGSPDRPLDYLAYYARDLDYLYFRMRLDGAVSSSYGEALYVFIDLTNYSATGIPGCPDYALRWELATGMNLLPIGIPDQGNKGKWLWMDYEPPFIALDDSYLRAVTGLPDAGFGSDDCWVDWAISYADLVDSEIDPYDGIRVNYGSGVSPLTQSPKNNYWDIAGGEVARENEFYDDECSWSPQTFPTSTETAVPEPASTALTLLALGIVGGAVRRRRGGTSEGADRHHQARQTLK